MKFHFLCALAFSAIFILPTKGLAVEKFDSEARCNEVRLDRDDRAFTQIPVYNQAIDVKSDPDICYAVAASELIDAHRFQSGENLVTLSSPLSIALKARSDDLKLVSHERVFTMDDSNPVTYMVGGGNMKSALEANQGQKVCDQRWLDDRVKLISEKSGGLALDSFLINSNFGRSSHIGPELISKAISHLDLLCVDHVLTNQYPKPIELLPPCGNYLDAQLVLAEKLKDPNITQPERKRLAQDFYQLFDEDNEIQVLGEQVMALLDGPHPQAVGIGYVYSAIQSIEFRGSIGAHASVIIGRKINSQNKRCEFLVRDSYGSECNDKNGQPRYSLPCENGSVWVDARSLMKSTMALTWIPY